MSRERSLLSFDVLADTKNCTELSLAMKNPATICLQACLLHPPRQLRLAWSAAEPNTPLSCPFAGDTGGGAATSQSQRDRLMTANDRAKQTSQRIAEGKKARDRWRTTALCSSCGTAGCTFVGVLQAPDFQCYTARLPFFPQTLLETEDIGVSILGNLHKQRETIVRSGNTVRSSNRPHRRYRKRLSPLSTPCGAHSRSPRALLRSSTQLQGVDENIGVARRYLGQMGKRAVQNKIMLVRLSSMFLECVQLELSTPLTGFALHRPLHS